MPSVCKSLYLSQIRNNIKIQQGVWRDDITDLCVKEARALYHPAGPTLSPAYKEEEPRKRAPRALTGRYVRTGTAASPRVLQILRKKVEDRLKLKELLGENSHLYFGSGKQASQSPYKQQAQQRPKKKILT